MRFRNLFACGTLLAALGAAETAPAAENGFLTRFNGSWAGSGTIVAESVDVLKFSCNATGKPEENQIAIAGNCKAFLGSRNFAARLTFDPASGRYVGTYVGHKVGPARLSGKRRGNVVDLTITWPKPVHGDLKAKMIIENAGKGVLKIMIADEVAPGGPEARTDFVLRQT